tara:strand:+ start:89 stop:1153 length:1065 start_codon:yes stop_codon:yes gene_type:complete
MALPIKLSGLGKQANALVRNAGSQLSSSVSDIGKNLTKSKLNVPEYLASNNTDGLIYPLVLRGQPNVNIIEFKAFENRGDGVKQHHIWFPCPANIAINDSATYNTIDLGALGGAAAATAQDALSSGSGVSGLAGGVGSQIQEARSSFKEGEQAAAALQMLPFSDEVFGASKLASRVLLNPNTNTTFSGNAIRSFTFAFKMIAHSPEEAEMIRKIHSKFRSFTYADSRSNAQSMILAFPPTWTIRFLDGNLTENKFIPKIFSCYLVSIESSFNSTTNMFHRDGAPLEVDVSISYQETRTLTRTDIDGLEEGSLGVDRGIDSETGAPAVSGNPKGIVDADNKRQQAATAAAADNIA